MLSEKHLNLIGAAVVALMLGAILSVAISEVHSFDVFWQLQSGKYMWQTGEFIHTDLFTLAPDSPRYEHTWIHDLVLYATQQMMGYDGISILKGVLLFATLVVLVSAAKLRGASWTAVALLTPLFLLSNGGWLERPQLWTFLMFALFVLTLDWVVRHNSWHVFWIFPLAVIWANLHAGSVLSVAIISAYLVGSLGNSAVKRQIEAKLWSKLFAAMGLVCAAAFLTPYPDKLLNTLKGSTNLGAKVDAAGKVSGPTTAMFNMDWTPTSFLLEPYFYYAMVGVVIIMLLGWRRLNLIDVCLMAGLALMGQKLVRHVPFFYFGAVALMPAYLDAAVEPIKKRLPEIARKVVVVAFLGFSLCGFWVLWQPLYKVYGLFEHGLREWHYPIEATEFLEKHQLKANLYNTYDWGGYLAWQLFPEYSVFWDGRQTSKKMFDLGWLIMSGKPEWQLILDKFEVNTIITRSSTIDTGQKYPVIERLRRSNDWFLVFNDESSMVFVLQDSMPETWLQKYAKPKIAMDDTILSEAILMAKVAPRRYMAWWEMAQIFLKRKDYNNALLALDKHLYYSPVPNPKAVSLRNQLMQFLQRQRQQMQ
mgnify:CR=1 FL=1